MHELLLLRHEIEAMIAAPDRVNVEEDIHFFEKMHNGKPHRVICVDKGDFHLVITVMIIRSGSRV
jgi:hypothetical protein